MHNPSEVCLGDGLYAHCDGWRLLLRAPREEGEGDHWVGLEPEALIALVEYVARLKTTVLHQVLLKLATKHLEEASYER
jgi:hypothetical protein